VFFGFCFGFIFFLFFFFFFFFICFCLIFCVFFIGFLFFFFFFLFLVCARARQPAAGGGSHAFPVPPRSKKNPVKTAAPATESCCQGGQWVRSTSGLGQSIPGGLCLGLKAKENPYYDHPFSERPWNPSSMMRYAPAGLVIQPPSEDRRDPRRPLIKPLLSGQARAGKTRKAVPARKCEAHQEDRLNPKKSR